MGSVLPVAGSAPVNARVHTTASLESLTLFRGKEPIQVVQPAVFADCTASRRITASVGAAVTYPRPQAYRGKIGMA
ncbi:MAG: hypothetical protein R3E79_41405 [Caldilineaceae bacterium]